MGAGPSAPVVMLRAMRRGAIGCLAAVFIGAGASGQQPVTAEAEGRVWQVRIEGDLDCMKMARDVTAELARARNEKAGLVVLDVDAARSRPDVVWEMGKAVREGGVPAAVFLHNGPDGRVGAGALELGVLAGAAWVGPRTVVRQAPADDLRWMAPAEVSWERVERELSGALWVRLKEKEADPGLASVLVAPSKGCWCVRGAEDRHWTLVASEPAKGPQAEQVVFAGAEGYLRLEIGAEALEGLGVARAAPNASQVIAAGGKTGATRVTRTIKNGLSGARGDVGRLLDEARASAHRATDLLDVKTRTKKRVASAADYHAAGREALAELEQARARVDETERVIAEYPEVLRQPPVSKTKRTTVKVDPVSAAIAECRKDQEKLAAQARDYAAR